MDTPEMKSPRLALVRPLVRYVDESQAVIDVHLAIHPVLPRGEERSSADVLVEIAGTDGSIDEQHLPVRLRHNAGVVRLQVVRPERWWPAGMGDQSLYRIRVSLLCGEGIADSREVTLGFTSVRAKGVFVSGNDGDRAEKRFQWLVNSEVCEIDTVVPIDLVHERRLLPVAGHSLLIVRGHYGPDVLYDAADRAGLLLIQCVPIEADGEPEVGVLAQIDRLASHPSLAGWFVGHLGRLADNVAHTIRELDPTRHVFRHVPGA